MGLFTRMSNGWEMAKTSLTVLNANKQLLIFPVLSGLAIALAIGSFIAFLFPVMSVDTEAAAQASQGLYYLFVFLFYIVIYFVVVFFNMGLMHCAKLYFEGEEVSVAKGLKY